MSMPSDPTPFAGRLSDGRTAARTPSRSRLAEAGLEICRRGERRARWCGPTRSLRSSVPLHAGAADVLLSRNARRRADPVRRRPGVRRATAGAGAALSAARQRWRGLRPGIAPSPCAGVARRCVCSSLHPAQAVARLMPQQTREAWAARRRPAHRPQSLRDAGRPRRARPADPRLTAAAADKPHAVRVVLLDWALVNAFAVPGGQIILTRGLVQKAASPDEVAGVLAHELGHALELHPEAGLVRALGLSAAAQLDLRGLDGHGQQHRPAADPAALHARCRARGRRARPAHPQDAGISAKGFGDFFERLEPKLQPGRPRRTTTRRKTDKKKVISRPAYLRVRDLRTHPLTAERLALVRAQPAYPATPALSDEDWRALREVCGAAVIAPRPRRVPPPPTVPPPPGRASATTTPTPPPSRRPPDATDSRGRSRHRRGHPGAGGQPRRRRRPAAAATRLPRRPARGGHRRLHQGQRSCGPPTPACTSAAAARTRACASTSRRSSPTTRRSGSTPTMLWPATARQHQPRAQALPGGAHRFR